ncbi:hypothetical protein C8R41DRAFT_923070 [Lentinula lateritia]|uniref:Uncharacterized protein n=1 Tax=Lentinula lateritia TaxID=40482 RepID=A0ABQ8VAE1_9AGAR|nr:hypothetical protein C8R41DRAFT_923070 [Lentinula lateritia]
MSFTSPSTVIGAPNPVSPPAFPPPHPNSAEMPVDAAIDELASTIEEPSRSTSLQDQQELDCLELGDFLRKQPQVPGPPATSSLPPPSPSVMATPCVLAKKRKSSVWQEEGGFSWRKHPVGEVSELDVVPEAHDRKHKCPVGGSRDAEVPDYRRVVLVLCPLLVDTPDSATLSGGPVNEIVHFPPPSEESGSNRVPLPQSQGRSSDLLTHKQSNPPGESPLFLFPDLILCLMPVSQHSREALHPYPQAQATAALKADKKALWAEVADLHKLLEASCTKTLTLTSLLWDTLTSLNNCNKDLEFMAIEAELPEAPLEDALTQFHVAVSEVQRQKLLELHEQVDKEQKRSYEPTRNWTLLMHVLYICGTELIRKSPEDEGLYEVDLPLLSSLQDKLTASEAMLHRMATFAHWLHSADPANLLHHHNMYMGGLIEPVITLLPRSLLHPPEQMRSIVKLAQCQVHALGLHCAAPYSEDLSLL